MENAETWKNRRILTLDQHFGVRIHGGNCPALHRCLNFARGRQTRPINAASRLKLEPVINNRENPYERRSKSGPQSTVSLTSIPSEAGGADTRGDRFDGEHVWRLARCRRQEPEGNRGARDRDACGWGGRRRLLMRLTLPRTSKFYFSEHLRCGWRRVNEKPGICSQSRGVAWKKRGGRSLLGGQSGSADSRMGERTTGTHRLMSRGLEPSPDLAAK